MEVMNSLKKHRKENPFVQIDRAIIDDPRLSWKAKGLLMYLLAQSDSWQFYETEICTHSSDGRTSVASGLSELEKNGYLVRTWIRDNNGRYVGRSWDVFEEPIEVDPSSKDDEIKENSIGCRKPDSGKNDQNIADCRKPEIGLSEAGKPATNNINNNNKKEEEEEGQENQTENLPTDELHNSMNHNSCDEIPELSADELSDSTKDISELGQEIMAFQNYTAIDISGDARKKTYQKWRTEWGFSHEMIMKAAELTCQLAKIPNLQYIDKILCGWMASEIRTVGEADLAIIRFRDLKGKGRSQGTNKDFSQKAGSYSEYEFYVPPEAIEELKRKEV